MPDPGLEACVVEVLTPLLGLHTSRRAFALACERAGRAAETATADDVEDVCEGLVPMLRTLLGAESAARVVRTILRRAGRSP